MKSFLCLAILAIFFPLPLPVLPYLNPGSTEGYKSSTQSILAAPFRTIRSVVIDAGHGGKDFGAVSPWGIKEKEIALEMARFVRDELKQHGIRVIMTRNNDHFIPLSKRAQIANKKEVDLFVSIHANASVSPSLQGFEIYYLSDAPRETLPSIFSEEDLNADLALGYTGEATDDLKAVLLDLRKGENRRQAIRVAGFIRNSVGNSVAIFANRLRAANFYVLRTTECPAVLVEIGYLTNQEDAAQLAELDYKKKMAHAIVWGILNYKFEFERTNGFSK